MIITFIFLVCLVTSSYTQRVDGVQNILKDDLALERQLKFTNKLPTKSIQSKYGYIVDCIDINNQPAFDHPLLKNHRLQSKPSFQQTKAKTSVYNSTPKLKPFLEKIVCPIGKVPIRRTTKEDLIKSKSSFNTEADQVKPGIHVAEVYLRTRVTESYYGVRGTSSIYNPKVTSKDQTSAVHAWVENGVGDGTNKIYAGWHVDPQLHGDEGTYAYTEWTSDNFNNTGCFNLRCPGFVQTSQEMFLDARVEKISVYDGVMVEMPITLTKDSETNNWWLSLDNTWVGYFPAALFSNLKSGEKVGWGGRTTTTSATTIPPLGMVSPQMGSGFFPDFTYHHASYFIHMEYQYQPGNHTNPTFVPPNKDRINWVVDNEKCFGNDYDGNIKTEGLGHSMEFGGPGGQCDASLTLKNK